MTPQELKNSILKMAFIGKLSVQDKSEQVEESKVDNKKNKNIKSFKFDLPENWVLSTIEGISKTVSTKKYQIKQTDVLSDGNYPVISQSNEFITGYYNDSDKLYKNIKPVVIFGDHTTVVKYIDFDFVVGADGVKIFEPFSIVDAKYLCYCLSFITIGLDKQGRYSRHYKFIKDEALPIPPLNEQKRIVEKIEELMPLVEAYEESWKRLEELNKKFPEDMKKSLLQEAIKGKLVEQRPEEGTGEELYETIQAEKKKLIKEGKIKKQKALSEITEDEMPFEIPESWKWVRLGDVSTIARGGSPRPIKDYITQDDDGINWIKIGDTEKNSKYINSTIEKIKPEGLKKSRLVKPGDFLLTNSMSFGRPYILNIEGCIHDGWLVISQDSLIYNKDFLYWMLSSGYAFNQFARRVSGAVVKNLNSDKVSESIFPLPPLNEQKRIVERLEELLPLCDQLMTKAK